MKQKTRYIESWNDLVDLIESINRFKETIVLSGWTNEPVGDTYKIRSLVFTTKPVDILMNEYNIIAIPMKRKKKDGKHNAKPEGERETSSASSER